MKKVMFYVSYKNNQKGLSRGHYKIGSNVARSWVNFKINNKRFFHCSKVYFGGPEKFFKILDITNKVLSRGFSKNKIKEISNKNKEEVMKSINHYQGEIEGEFIINNGNVKNTAFVGITHSKKHDVKDYNNEPIKQESYKINDNVYIGPELRLTNNIEIDKNKLYNGKNKTELKQYKQLMENKINEVYKEGSIVPYIIGIENNKINEGIISKKEKNGKIFYNLNDLNVNLNKIDKINKD